MKNRLQSLRRNTGLRFNCALALLVWSLLPHYFLVLHSHKGGNASHSHAQLARTDSQAAHEHAHEAESITAENVALANQILAILESSKDEPEALGAQEKASKPHENAPITASEPDPNLAAGSSNSGLHGHIGQDPNLSGVVAIGLPAPTAPPEVTPEPSSYLSPELPSLLLRQARGPPAPCIA